MAFKELLDKALEPLRAFAERIDAHVERKSGLQPALATAQATGAPAFQRSTTSTLSLTAPAPPAAKKKTPERAPTAPAPRRLPAHGPTGTRPQVAATGKRPPMAATAPPPIATVLVEGPAGESFRLPAATPFTAQISTQSPGGGPVVSRVLMVLVLGGDGTVTFREPAGGTYLAGKTASVESDGRSVTLTVGYNQTDQAGQGTLFVGFTDGRLTYLSGSGTARDPSGQTVVRDISSVRGGTAATTTSSRRTRPGSTPALHRS